MHRLTDYLEIGINVIELIESSEVPNRTVCYTAVLET